MTTKHSKWLPVKVVDGGKEYMYVVINVSVSITGHLKFILYKLLFNTAKPWSQQKMKTKEDIWKSKNL